VDRRHRVMLRCLSALQLLYLKIILINTKDLTNVRLKLTYTLADLMYS